MYMNPGIFEYLKDSQIKQQLEQWYIKRWERKTVSYESDNVS
jgi:hypothetical protein